MKRTHAGLLSCVAVTDFKWIDFQMSVAEFLDYKSLLKITLCAHTENQSNENQRQPLNMGALVESVTRRERRLCNVPGPVMAT